ncbi:hypothetical protein V6N12_012488 [Hibiscus sabdariffa]|uniref:Uncharacterized protein n=1 Tax=Hibiscus sabdariffa TaxID=183260 RepID=A0ABR2AYR9_9ROSI
MFSFVFYHHVAPDSMLHRLGDLTFTSEEQGVVITPSLVWFTPSDDCDLSLIGRVILEKEVDGNALIHLFTSILKNDKILSTLELKSNFSCFVLPTKTSVTMFFTVALVALLSDDIRADEIGRALGSCIGTVVGIDTRPNEGNMLDLLYCGIIGYLASSCTLVQGEVTKFQYGDWLRATTTKSPFCSSHSRGQIRYHDKPNMDSGYVQSAARNESTSDFSNLGGTNSVVLVVVVVPIEQESMTANLDASSSALPAMPIAEPLAPIAADLVEPVVVVAESSVLFDMDGSMAAVVALLFYSDDVDGQSGIPSTDNTVDPLLDFEAWLNQPPQASNFEVNGENDEKVLASHATEVRVHKRSLVLSSSVHAKRHHPSLTITKCHRKSGVGMSSKNPIAVGTQPHRSK